MPAFAGMTMLCEGRRLARAPLKGRKAPWGEWLSSPEVRAASAPVTARPNPKANRRPSNPASKLDPAMVTVRKPGDPAPALPTIPPAAALTQKPVQLQTPAASPVPAPVQVAQNPAPAEPHTDTKKAPPRIRNAFGGLTGSRSLGSAMHSQGSYAQIQPR